jgi:hypothetical protein
MFLLFSNGLGYQDILFFQFSAFSLRDGLAVHVSVDIRKVDELVPFLAFCVMFNFS